MQYVIQNNSKGTPFALFGINAELARWIYVGTKEHQKHCLAYNALRVAKPYSEANGISGAERLMDALLPALGGAHGQDILASERFIYEHWHAHPEVGPYPCAYLLSEYQMSGIFYRGYRDHVAHQLKVYLLGLYFYDQCNSLKDEIDAAMLASLNQDPVDIYTQALKRVEPVQREFLLRWLVAALAHDIGYLAENEAVTPNNGSPFKTGPSWKDFLSNLSRDLQYPILPVLGVRNVSNFQEMHEEICGLKSSDYNIKSEVLLEDLKYWPGGPPSNSWALLDENSDKAIHCHSQAPFKFNGLLETYYRLTPNTEDIHCRTYYDHGVISSLLLLRLWGTYEHCVRCFAEESQRLPGQFKQVKDWPAALVGQRIQDAALAIALHNINPLFYGVVIDDNTGSRINKDAEGIEGKRQAWTDHGLPLQLGIRLGGSNALPIAFLLRFCDILQNWDRSQFKPLSPNDQVLEAKDVSIRCDTYTVHLLFRSDFLSDDIQRTEIPMRNNDTYSQARQELFEGLNKEDVERILKFDVMHDKSGLPDWPATKTYAREFDEVSIDGGVKALRRCSETYRHFPSIQNAEDNGESSQTSVSKILSLSEKKDRHRALCFGGNTTFLPASVQNESSISMLESAAEWARSENATFEIVYSYRILKSMHRSVLLLLKPDTPKDDFLYEAQNVYTAASDIITFFDSEVAKRRHYPICATEFDATERLRHFLLCRLSEKTTATDRTDVNKVTRFITFLASFVKKNESPPVWNTKKELNELISKHRGFFEFLETTLMKIITSLLEVTVAKSQCVTNEFENSLLLGELRKSNLYATQFIRDRIEKLNENSNRKGRYRIWKSQ